MASTLLSLHSFFPIHRRREEIGKLSAFRTSFGGQVLCNPSFCGTQIAINNHGNRLVVNPSMALMLIFLHVIEIT
ncbi:hypothetical protein S245_025328 [Arachis hypogaea]